MAALEHFSTNAPRYSLIITDVRMPTMSGSELANHAKKIRPDIKVLVMTAYEVDKELQKLLPLYKGRVLAKAVPYR